MRSLLRFNGLIIMHNVIIINKAVGNNLKLIKDTP